MSNRNTEERNEVSTIMMKNNKFFMKNNKLIFLQRSEPVGEHYVLTVNGEILQDSLQNKIQYKVRG